MTAELTRAIAELRRRNEPVPRPPRLPTEGEVAAAERALRFTFSPDYRQFLISASDVTFGTLEPCMVTPDAGHLDLVRTATDAWDEWGVPRGWLPFCEDNADFYCLDGCKVRFWSHNGQTDEAWPSLGSWIMDVWIGESEGRPSSSDIRRR